MNYCVPRSLFSSLLGTALILQGVLVPVNAESRLSALESPESHLLGLDLQPILGSSRERALHFRREQNSAGSLRNERSGGSGSPERASADTPAGRSYIERQLNGALQMAGERLSGVFSNKQQFSSVLKGIKDGDVDLRERLLLTGQEHTQLMLDAALDRFEQRFKKQSRVLHDLELSYRAPFAGREGLFHANATLALWENSGNLLFGQGGLVVRDGEEGANIGLGYRFMAGPDLLLGANTFYDYLSDPGVERWSLGAEARSSWLDLHGNWYQGRGSDRDGDILYYSPDGWDVELAAHLPQAPWVELGASYYLWDGEGGQDDLEGQRYRLSLKPSTLLSMDFEYDDPDEGDGSWGVEFGFNYQFGVSLSRQLDFIGQQGTPDLWSRRYEKVEREYAIRVRERRTAAVVPDPEVTERTINFAQLFPGPLTEPVDLPTATGRFYELGLATTDFMVIHDLPGEITVADVVRDSRGRGATLTLTYMPVPPPPPPPTTPSGTIRITVLDTGLTGDSGDLSNQHTIFVIGGAAVAPTDPRLLIGRTAPLQQVDGCSADACVVPSDTAVSLPVLQVQVTPVEASTCATCQVSLPPFDLQFAGTAVLGIDYTVNALTLTPTRGDTLGTDPLAAPIEMSMLPATASDTFTVTLTSLSTHYLNVMLTLTPDNDREREEIQLVYVDEAGSRGAPQTVLTLEPAGTLLPSASVAITPLTELTERSLVVGTATAAVTLIDSQYVAAGALDAADFTLTANVPGTVTVAGVTRTPTVATLTLRHEGADISVDGTLNVIVEASAHTGAVALYADGNVPITAMSGDATLSGLTVTPGTLTPPFVAATTDYTLNVASTVTDVMLTATAADTGATLSVSGSTVASGSVTTISSLTPGGTRVVPIVVTAADGRPMTYQVTITNAPDLIPTFGSQTVAAQRYTLGVNVGTVQLPTATGGDGALSYTLTPALPNGLSFDATNRQISGTPTATVAATPYTLTATDSDATSPDQATLSFPITVSVAGPLAAVLTASPALTEANLDGAMVRVTLMNTLYVDAASLNASGFMLSENVAGDVTVSGVVRDSDTVATLTLAHDGTDLSADGTLGVTVLAAAHASSGNLVTGTVSITFRDDIAPMLSTATVNRDMLMLVYDEALNETPLPDSGDYAVMVGGSAGPSVSGVAIDDRTVLLTLASMVTSAQDVTLDYTPVSNPVQDTAGNEVAALDDRVVTNDTRPFVISVALTSDPGADETYAIGEIIEATLTFNENVTVVGIPSIAIGVGATDLGALFAAGSGTTQLAFRRTVEEGNADTDGVSISANSYLSRGGTIQGATGANANLVTTPGLPDQSGHRVDGVRPVLGSATVNGDMLVLTYNKALNNTTSTPANDAYAVMVGGSTGPAVNNVAISGMTVTLTLATAVTGGLAVTLDYTPPGTNPVQDTFGNDAVMLDEQTVTNSTGVPVISIAAGTAVDEGTAATFTLTADPAPGTDLTVTVTVTEAGNFIAGAAPTTVTITGSETTAMLEVPTMGDSIDEANGTITATVEDGTGYTVAGGGANTASVTVNDDDAAPTLAIDSPSVNEGDASETPTLSYTVTLTGETEQEVMVDYADATSGSATSGGTDYETITADTLTFAPGTTTQNIDVTVTGDVADEGDETVIVTLSNPVNAMITTTTGTGTIINDDGAVALPSISIAAGTSPVTEGTAATFTLTADSAPGTDLIVTVTVTDSGNFIAGAAPTTVTITGSTTTAMLEVPTMADSINEANGTITATVESGGGYTVDATNNSDSVTVNDDDALPTLAIDSPSVNEGDAGSTTLSYIVTLTGETEQEVTVDYADATSGTATSGTDYTAITGGTLTFASGTTTQNIDVTVTGDTDDEPNDTVILRLSNPVNATITNADGTGTITNDDSAVALPSISITAGTAVTEGANATFTLTADSAPVGDLTVTVTVTETGNFIASPAPTTVTIADGATTATLEVPTMADLIDEANGMITAMVEGGAGYTVDGTNNSASVTVNDDDEPTLAIDSPSVAEGDSGSTTLTYIVTLTGETEQEVTVDYADATSGTATSGTDYTAITGGTLTFASGTTTQNIDVTVTGDTDDEPNDTVILRLSNPVNATITNADGTGTITNDDSAVALPSISITAGTAVTEGANATFMLTADSAPVGDLTVTVTVTETGNFIASPAPTTVTIADGATTATLEVPTMADLIDEANGMITAMVEGGAGYTVDATNNSASVTVNDDDEPTLAIDSPSVAEGDSGSTTLTYIVTLTGETEQEVMVDYADADSGTATSGGTDYETITADTLTFAPGTTTQNIDVTVTGDVADEGDETVIVTLSNPVNAMITTADGTGTITNDDAAVAAPTVSTVEISSDGPYTVDDDIEVTVTFSEAVTVDTASGTPQIPLVVGTNTRQAAYTSGSTTAALVFTYTVVAGETDADGVSIVENTLSGNSGTIQNSDGTDAVLDHPAVAADTAHAVDTTAPTVDTVAISTTGPYGVDGVIDVTVTFDEVVTVDTTGGTPQIPLMVGTATRQAAYISGIGTAALVFTYTVVAGDNDANGVSIASNTLALNSGAIRDAAGNDAELDHNEVAADTAHAVDDMMTSDPSARVTAPVLLTESNLNGATLVVTLTGTEYVGESELVADDFTLSPTDVTGVTVISVTRDTTTTATLMLAHDNTSITVDGSLGVTVLDAGHTGSVDLDAGAVPIINEPTSDDATLADLMVFDNAMPPGARALAPAFDGSMSATTYAVTVESTVIRAMVTPMMNHPRATFTVDTFGVISGDRTNVNPATIDLNTGEALTVTINMVAEDASTETYTVVITRLRQTAVFERARVNGANLILEFSGRGLERSSSTPSTQDFTVRVNSAEVDVGSVTITGDRVVTLVLETAVTLGQMVTLSYTPGTSPLLSNAGDPAIKLVPGGSPVSTLRDEMVRNETLAPAVAPVLVGAEATGTTTNRFDELILIFDAPLHLRAGSIPELSDFVVRRGGATGTVLPLPAFGNVDLRNDPVTNVGNVRLTFIGAVRGDYTVSYTPSGTTRLRGLLVPDDPNVAGAEVAALVNMAITATGTAVPLGVSTVAISSTGPYGVDGVIEVTVIFSEVVTVDTAGGTPQIPLMVGANTRQAVYTSGSTTAALVFTYTVVAGETDADGVSITANTLSRNGGTIQNAGGTDANLAHFALAAALDQMVNTSIVASPSITIAADTSPVTEGTAAAFTLTASPPAPVGGLTVTVSVSQTGTFIEGVAPTTVTIAAAATTAPLTVPTTDDDIDEADGSVTATVTAGTGYMVGTGDTASVTVNDDDTAGVTVAPTMLTVDEAGSDTTADYTVVLDTAPTDDVTIAVASDTDTAATVSSASLTFTPTDWDTAQTVTVTGVNDDVPGDRTATVSHTAASTDGNYEGVAISIASVTVTVTDDDAVAAGVTVTPETLSVPEDGGTTVDYTLVLDTAPTADVTIAVASDTVTAATVSSASLTFTPANWNTAQTVTVTGVNDDVDNPSDERTASLSHTATSTDGDYEGVAITIASVTVTVTDDDDAGVTVDPLAFTVDEAGSNTTADYTVVLDTAPTADVTIAVASDTDTAATVSLASLTFTPTNWDTAQTVTVTGVNDDVPGDRTATVTHTAASADGNYEGVAISIASVTVTVNDDDAAAAGVTVTPTAFSVPEDGGTTADYTVVLDTAPTADVTIAVASDTVTAATVSSATLTFTPANWNTAQTVTVTGVNDNVDNPSDERTASLSHTATSADGDYEGVAIASVTVTVTDDDDAGVTVDPMALTVDEAGSGTTADYTVVLDTAPTADVTITPESGDTLAATVSPTSLTFTPANWNTAQTVTVTGVNDDVPGDRTATVTHMAASGDTAYNSVSIDSVTVTVEDDDAAAPGVTVDPVTLSVPEDGSSTADYTLVLDTAPTADVTIAIESDTDTAATVSSVSLTFTPTDWNTAQTVTVTGVNDDVPGDRTATVTHTAASTDGNYEGVAISIASVTVTVNDDDAAAAGVTVTPETLSVPEDGGEGTYTLVLDTAPTADVTIAVASDTDTAATVSSVSLTFTPTDWNTAQTVTVTGVNDDVPGDRTATVTHTAASTDGNYEGAAISIASVTVTVEDDDGLAARVTAPVPLTESNLDGAMLVVTLTGTEYVGESELVADDFMLSLTGVAGVTVDSVSRDSTTRATLVLEYDETPIDVDDSMLGVMVLADGHTGSDNLDAGAVPIINEPTSTDATLADLMVFDNAMPPGARALTPAFDGSMPATTYAVTVESTVIRVMVTPIRNHPRATFTVDTFGAISGDRTNVNPASIGLNTGEALTVIINVVAEDASTETYTVVITRLSQTAVFRRARVNDAELRLEFSESSLQQSPTPSPEDFTVRVDSTEVGVESVAIPDFLFSRVVILELEPPVTTGQTVTLSYTPGTSPLLSSAGGRPAIRLVPGGSPVSTLTDEMVDNITPPPPMLLGATVMGLGGSMSPFGEFVLVFDAPLVAGTPDSSAFTVTRISDGMGVALIFPPSSSTTEVTLTFEGFMPSVEYSMTYTPPAMDALAGQNPFNTGVAGTRVEGFTATATSPPVVSTVEISSTGPYALDDDIEVTVTFSEAVTVDTTSGTPQIPLVVGANTRQAAYTSGSTTAALVFTYTVVADETDADGVSIVENTLIGNGGTIQNVGGTDADLDHLAVDPDTANAVDTTAPTVATVAITSAGPYGVGDDIDVTVTFSEVVTVDTTGGTPQIPLMVGASTSQATFSSGSDSVALVFTYTVQAGDSDTDGVDIDADALALNSGTIQDAAGNNATLTHTAVDADSGNAVDTTVPTAPTVSTVEITSTGPYALDEEIEVTVTFSEAVTVDTIGGTPQIPLTVGTTTRSTTTVSGSDTDTLVFTYTVAAGDNDADGVSIVANTLALNSGTIQSAGGADANLDHSEVAADTANAVDTTAPTVATVAITSTGPYVLDDDIEVTVTFSEAVTVDTTDGTPQIPLMVGASTSQATFSSGSDSVALVFTYTVQAGDSDTDGVDIDADALALNSGTIQDAAGNNATLTHTAVDADSGNAVDTTVPTAPTVSTVEITSTGPYALDEEIEVTVTFSEAVTVDTTGGTPQIPLTVGTTTRSTTTVSGSDTDTLVFTYTVAAGDNDADGVSIVANTLALNSGTIQSAGGADANLDHSEVAADTANAVDTTAPTVATVAITSAGPYVLDDDIEVTVTFSEAVTVDTTDGTPQIPLMVGASTSQATFSSGSDSVALVFTYTVQAGDSDTDGVDIDADALALNSGTIQDAAGNNATLTHTAVDENSTNAVDTTAPAVSTVEITSTGPYALDEEIEVTVTFTEAVTVDTTGGTPQITLMVGSTARSTIAVTGTGTATLVFTYTVQVGDSDTDGVEIAADALALNGGTIQDAAGNNAVLTHGDVDVDSGDTVSTASPAVSGVEFSSTGP